jgi:hypothetical protein
VRAVLLPPTAAGEEAAASGGLVDEATLPLLHGAMVRRAERREKQAARAQVGGFPVYGAVWGGGIGAPCPGSCAHGAPITALQTLSGSHGGADIIYHGQSRSWNGSQRRRISVTALVI